MDPKSGDSIADTVKVRVYQTVRHQKLSSAERKLDVGATPTLGAGAGTVTSAFLHAMIAAQGSALDAAAASGTAGASGLADSLAGQLAALQAQASRVDALIKGKKKTWTLGAVGGAPVVYRKRDLARVDRELAAMIVASASGDAPTTQRKAAPNAQTQAAAFAAAARGGDSAELSSAASSWSSGISKWLSDPKHAVALLSTAVDVTTTTLIVVGEVAAVAELAPAAAAIGTGYAAFLLGAAIGEYAASFAASTEGERDALRENASEYFTSGLIGALGSAGDLYKEVKVLTEVSAGADAERILFNFSGAADWTNTVRDVSDLNKQLADDKPAGVRVESDAEEAGQDGEFTIYLPEAASHDQTVHYTLSGSASNGDDYNGEQSGEVVISEGQDSATVGIFANYDGVYDPDETVVLTLDGDTVDGAGSATMSIVDESIDEMREQDAVRGRVGERRVDLAESAEVGVEVDRVADVDDEDERRVVVGQRADVPRGLAAGLEHRVVPAPGAADAVTGRKAVQQ